MKWSILGLFALACLSSATVFHTGRSYTYDYNGWLKAAIPELEDQYAGIYINAKLVVEAESDQTLAVELRNLQAKKFNEDVPSQITTDFERWKNLGEPVAIVGSQCLEKPFLVNFRGVVFDSLTVSSNDPLWCVNFKKSIASKFQILIKSPQGTKGSVAAMKQLKSGGMIAYPVMEECVTGECETWYEITELPEENIKSKPELIPSPELCKGGNFFQVVKTRDFDKCKRPTIFARISPSGWRCAVDSAVCGGAKSRVSTQRITACEGKQGEMIIQRHIVSDIRVVQPYGIITEPMKGNAFVVLELESEGPAKAIASRQAAGGQTINSLLYTHTPLQKQGAQVPQPRLTDSLKLGGKRMDPNILSREIRRLMSEVTRDMESDEFYTDPAHLGVLDKVGMIRRAAAYLSYEELRSVFNRELNMDEDSTPFQVAKDCLVATGTNPAIMIVKELIQKNKLTGERARQAVAVLPMTIKTPTREILQQLFDLLDSKVVEEDEQLEITLALSLATIANQACVNKTLSRRMYPVAVMGEFCSPSDPIVVRKLVPYFSNRIQRAESNGEVVAFLAALGNLGHESIIPVIIPVIEEGTSSTSESQTRSFRRARSIKSSSGLEEEEEELGMSRGSKKKNYRLPEWEMSGGMNQGYGSSLFEEEEEYELTPSQYQMYSIPRTETKLNKGLLHKYGVPEREIQSLTRRSSKTGGYYGGLEEEEEIELSPADRRRFGIPHSEKVNKGILHKYDVPEHEIKSLLGKGRKTGRTSESEYEEEEIELTPAERRKFNIPHHEKKVNKGILRKYGVTEEETAQLMRRAGKSGGMYSGVGSEYEEEELELSPAERRRFNIPHHEDKINKGILRKYGASENEISNLMSKKGKSARGYSGVEEEEEEIELSSAERRRFNIPQSEVKINKGILRKYGASESEISNMMRKSGRVGGRSSYGMEEEEEEEYELSPSQRQKWNIPSHEKLNKGLLHKYGVPEHEIRSMKSKGKQGSKWGSRYEEEEEEEEEYELSPMEMQRWSIPSHETRLNKGLLHKYGVPEHEIRGMKKSKAGKSGSRRQQMEEEEEEEYEMTNALREQYGISKHEKINKGILKKYNIPEHQVTSKKAYRGAESEWYRGKTRSGKGKKHFGRRRGRKGGKQGMESAYEEEVESDTIVRAKAVLALNKLVHAQNPKALHVVKSVFFNVNEEPEVRMAALNMIVHGNPHAEVWERVAVGTWFEPSEQVNSFVYTTLATLQQLEDPVLRNIALKAKAVLPLAKPVDRSFFGSANILTDAHDYSNSEGFIFHTSTFFGNSSYLPSNLYMNLNVNNGPFRVVHTLEASIFGRNLEKIFGGLYENLMGKSARRESASASDLHKIKQQLNISPRAAEAPEAFVNIKLLDEIQRFWEVDENVLVDLYDEFSDYFKTKGRDINYRKWIPLRDVYISAPSEMGIPFLVNIHYKGMASLNGNINATMSGLEAEINPTVGIKMVSQMGFDVPLVDKYVCAGVDTHLHLVLPISFDVKVDPSKAQATVDWEPRKSRLSLAHYHVKPFTATKDSLDYTPVNHATDLNEIAVRASPQEVTIPITSPSSASGASGQSTLGLNIFMTHKSDVPGLGKLPNLLNLLADAKEGKLVNWALPRDLRMHETKIVFDSAASETRAVRLNIDLTMAATTNVGANTVVRSGSNRPLESAKGRTVANIVGKLDQEKEIKLTSWFEKFSGGAATFIDVSAELIGAQNRRAEASLAVASSFMGHFQKVSVEAGKSQGNKFCFDTEIEWPKLTSLKREYYLGADISTNLDIKVGYGKNCENPSKVVLDVDGKMTRTPAFVSEVQAMDVTQECKREESIADMMVGSKACEKARRLATDLNRIELDIDVSDVSDVVANVSYQVQDFLTYIGGRYMSRDSTDVKNPKNKVKIILDVHPEKQETLSLKIFKPNTNIFFTGVPVGPITRTVVPVNVRLPFVANVLDTVRICSIENTKVSTFDNVLFEAPLSSCNHVIVKDCSGQRKVALLGREEAGNKIATIISENDEVVINPAISKVLVNGQEYTVAEDKWVILKDESGLPMLSMKKTRDGFIECLAQKYGVKVSVSPTKILVWGVGLMRGATCGICGNRDGEVVSDLQGPRGTTLSSGRRLVAAYMLNSPRNCDPMDYQRVQEEAVREEQQSIRNIPYSGLARTIQQEGVRTGSPLVAPSSQMTGSAGCMTLKNRMVSRGGTKCFSTVQLPECRSGCRAANTVEKRVGVHCVQKGRLADKLAEELRSRPLSELSEREEHSTERFTVPTSCIEA